MIPRPVPDALRIPANEAVLSYLERRQPGAHSDLAEAFFEADRNPDSGGWFVKNREFGWFVRFDDENRIYAAVFGMHAIWLRVGTRRAPRAIGEGARPVAELGADWVEIRMFRVEEPDCGHALLARWLAVAQGRR